MYITIKNTKQMSEFNGNKRSKEYKEWLNDNKRGLGDTIENITEKTGIKKLVEMFTPEGKDCGCDARKEKLNKIFPYKFKPVRCFTKEEYEKYKYYSEKRKIRISNEDLKYSSKLYAEIFNKQYKELCRCNPHEITLMIERLDKVKQSYEN